MRPRNEKIRKLYHVQIPTAVLKHHRFNDTTKIIFAVIYSLTRNYGYCFASNKTIATILNRSVATISRAIGKLADEQLLIIENPRSHLRKIRINEGLLEKHNCKLSIEGMTDPTYLNML